MEEREAEGYDCPICAEPLDDTDLALLPCPCDYQICLWCLQRIRERENNRCPQCRREYDEARYRRVRLDKLPRQLKKPANPVKERLDSCQRITCLDGQCEESGASASTARASLGKQPTICRLYNCPVQLMSAQILSQFRYLGKYGRLLSISIVPGKSSETAFITYAAEESALAAVQDVHKLTTRTSDPVLKQIRFQMGAARHCIQPLRGLRCANEPCQFIHCIPSKLPRCFWKTGRKWPWTASVCPETVIHSTIADQSKDSLFMKTLGDLAVMLPHLGIPSSAISAESRDLSAALNLTCTSGTASSSREDPAASDSQDDKPKRTWQKLSGALTEEEDPLFPALTTRPPAKAQQQANKKTAAPEQTRPPTPCCSLALIPPPPEFFTVPEPIEDFTSVQPETSALTKPQEAVESPTFLARDALRNLPMPQTQLEEPATVCKAAPGIKVFLPPPGLAVQKPAETSLRPPPSAEVPSRPPPPETQAADGGGSKVGRIYELFGWAKPSESTGAHPRLHEQWPICRPAGSKQSGMPWLRDELPHDRSSFISSQDFDLNYDPPAAAKDFLKASQVHDEDVSQWLASILAGTDEVNSTNSLYNQHPTAQQAPPLQWDPSYLSCYGAAQHAPSAGIEHYNTQRRPAKRADHRRRVENPAGMDLLRSVIPNATISFAPNMMSYRPLRPHMNEEREA